MTEDITDKQLGTPLLMAKMILEDCKDLEEAKGKVRRLVERLKGEED